MIIGASKRGVVRSAEQSFFRTPVSAGVVLEKQLGEGCVQDMGKVVKMAQKLRELARRYADVSVACVLLCFDIDTKQYPEDYDGCEIIARLSFGEEFSARSWVQVGEGIFECCQQLRQKLM